MQDLAGVKQSRQKFTEVKTFELLEAPLTQTGVMSYIAPDTVMREIRTPQKERFEIQGNQLKVVRNGTTRMLDLKRVPVVHAFIESFRATLSGDIERLKKYYTMTFKGTQAQWEMRLTPIDPRMKKYVSLIRFQGNAGNINRIEIRERNGDTSRMKLTRIPPETHVQ